MTNLKLNLKDILIDALGETMQLPATIKIEKFVEFNDIHEHEVDLQGLLAKERKIAQVWSIEDVQNRRPDLNDEQAWQLLDTFHRHYDSHMEGTWDELEQIAHDLFGSGNAQRVDRCAKAPWH